MAENTVLTNPRILAGNAFKTGWLVATTTSFRSDPSRLLPSAPSPATISLLRLAFIIFKDAIRNGRLRTICRLPAARTFPFIVWPSVILTEGRFIANSITSYYYYLATLVFRFVYNFAWKIA